MSRATIVIGIPLCILALYAAWVAGFMLAELLDILSSRGWLP